MNPIHRTIREALAFAALASLLAVAPRASAKGALTPLGQRTTDEGIAADLARIDAARARLDAASGTDVWRLARAKALLAAAGREYQMNDRTGFAEATFAEAQSLAGQIEGGAPAVTSQTVPPASTLPGSTRVRPELWTALEALKKSDGFSCAAEALAKAEVQLQWAGNEQVDQGECRTSPHLADAERLLTEARAQEAGCNAVPVVVAPKEVPAPAPVAIQPTAPVAPIAAVPTPEELRIPRNVHFALDKYFLSATSHDVIAGVVKVLKKYPTITVRLEGHTDSRASAAYNMVLSKNRVEAVHREMLALGIEDSRISTSFKGKSELKATEDSKANFARNRRVEMVFVDSSGLEIQAEEQEGDLQLEGSTPLHSHPAAAKPPVRKRTRHK